MSAPKPIRIVGGGLAGLTLGIALRQRNIPVTVVEAGKYPRHRVCGEFINGKGIEVLETLGLKQKLFDAGALSARTAAFIVGKSQSSPRQLPTSAICISRFTLDKLLADEFEILGGQLQTATRWQNGFGEGVVCATGRRSQPKEDGWRWFGLKAHARNVSLIADLEMHILDNGYLGICNLNDGKVDICGLFRRNESDTMPHNIFDLLRGKDGTVLHDRMRYAGFDADSFCSVAGLTLKPQRATEKDEVCIGDAITMIPPVTGNGMSLAFESAALATESLVDFSRGKISWAVAQRQIAQRCDDAFTSRLLWAKRLQDVLFSPPLRRILFLSVSRSDWVWRMTFERTR